MKCPDCGQVLNQVEVEELDKSFRCDNCGGFWMQGWVINRVSTGQMKTLEKNSNSVTTPAVRKCPVDGTEMSKPREGESFPAQLGLVKCPQCNMWWVPGNDLFELAQAYKAKKDYQMFWNKPAEWTAWAMPVVTVLLLTLGVAGGVYMVRYRQQAGIITADSGIISFAAVYTGQGQATVSFKSQQEVKFIEYRQENAVEWLPAPVILTGKLYITRLSGLTEGGSYEIRIGDKIFRLLTVVAQPN
ncbi:MAG: hypothetical protein UX87_C0012G0003 [Candidatus Amesbacteria bacterium GW2011_GWA1_47_16]|uniref:Transcription factor zinc-finger domain-containing protein n=2 Tax=Candidatus Amesiibacteriota TaxID=1752730 RepID=A0A0G1S3S1_9BACT|nr:MAG: hypothetical protein UX87_C0012G0003 [Candidatus Amesbacteria bacterium GW2011_GWA1_47_16]